MPNYYYEISDSELKSNSSKDTFTQQFDLYHDENLKCKVGKIIFFVVNINKNSDFYKCEQTCYTTILLKDEKINYDYVRHGDDTINTIVTYSSDKKIKFVKRKYLNKNVRKIKLN